MARYHAPSCISLSEFAALVRSTDIDTVEEDLRHASASPPAPQLRPDLPREGGRSPPDPEGGGGNAGEVQEAGAR
jgi:hypothetical protein